jgi:hypothetical protein
METALSSCYAPPESLELGRSNDLIYTAYQPLSYKIAKAVP